MHCTSAAVKSARQPEAARRMRFRYCAICAATAASSAASDCSGSILLVSIQSACQSIAFRSTERDAPPPPPRPPLPAAMHCVHSQQPLQCLRVKSRDLEKDVQRHLRCHCRVVRSGRAALRQTCGLASCLHMRFGASRCRNEALCHLLRRSNQPDCMRESRVTARC